MNGLLWSQSDALSSSLTRFSKPKVRMQCLEIKNVLWHNRIEYFKSGGTVSPFTKLGRGCYSVQEKISNSLTAPYITKSKPWF